MAAIHIWFPLQNVVATRGLVCYLGVFTDTCRAVERQLPSATMLNFASLSLSLICTLWLFLSVSLANVTQLRSQKPFPCGTWSDKFSEVLQAVIKDTKLVPRWLEVGCWIVRCCTKSRKKKSAATMFYDILICSWGICLFGMGLCGFSRLFLQHTAYYASHMVQWGNTQANSKWIRSGLGSSLAAAA